MPNRLTDETSPYLLQHANNPVDWQPWCDDAHVGTGFEPIEFEAPISGEFHMCGCKQSDNKPYCFGTCRGHTPENTKLDLF